MIQYSAVEWLQNRHDYQESFLSEDDFQTARQIEREEEYEIKAFWYGRGILAAKANKIKELRPTKDGKSNT